MFKIVRRASCAYGSLSRTKGIPVNCHIRPFSSMSFFMGKGHIYLWSFTLGKMHIHIKSLFEANSRSTPHAIVFKSRRMFVEKSTFQGKHTKDKKMS